MKKKFLAIAIALCGACGLVASAQTADKSYKPQKFTDFAFEGVLLEVDQQAKIDSINALYIPTRPVQQGQCCQAQAGQQCDKTAQGQCDKAAQAGKDCCKAAQDKQCDKAVVADSAAKSKDGRQMRKGHDKQAMQQGQRPGVRQGRGQRPANMNEYVAAVKEVLTPEQYVVFLENIATIPAPEPGQGVAPGHRDHKQMAQGHKDNKDRQAKVNKDKKDNKAKASKDNKVKNAKASKDKKDNKK